MSEFEPSPSLETQSAESIRVLEDYTNPERTINTQAEHPNSWWLELNDGENVTEGKLHLAPSGLERIVIYVPGLPGDSVQRFESDFLPELTQAGYSVFVIRHTGTRVDTEDAKAMVNSELRRARGDTIGLSATEQEASLASMINESRVALNIFGNLVDTREINIVSHSFGSLATGLSLSRYLESHPDKASKINKWISVAGMTGRLREEDVIDPERGFSLSGESAKYVYQESLPRGRYHVESFEAAVANIREAYQQLERLAHNLRSISIIAVNNPEDPQIGLVTARDLLQMAGRGLLLKDQTISEKEAQERGLGSVHNMPNTDPRNLVRVLKLTSPKSIREFTLGRKREE